MSETREPPRYLGSLIRRAQQRHVAVWLAEVSADVTSVQFAALAALQQHPGMSQRELGDELDIDRSTVAGLVSRLERDGRVARSADSKDARRNILSLTSFGIVTVEELRPKVERAQSVLAANISEGQSEELVKLLSSLVSGSESS